MLSHGSLDSLCQSLSLKATSYPCWNLSIGGRSWVWKEGSGVDVVKDDTPETCQLVSINRAFIRCFYKVWFPSTVGAASGFLWYYSRSFSFFFADSVLLLPPVFRTQWVLVLNSKTQLVFGKQNMLGLLGGSDATFLLTFQCASSQKIIDCT